MDTPTWLLPNELIRKDIVLSNDRQTIGRFGRTSHENNQWYRNLMICKNPHDNECASPLCCFLSQSSRIPMEPLSFYAKKHCEETSQNVDAKNMFIHLFRHHAAARSQAVAKLLGRESVTDDDCINIYAGKYGVKEMGALLEMEETDLSKAMSFNVVLHNTKKLKRFFILEDIWAIKTMLLADTLLFDPCRPVPGDHSDNFGEKASYTIFDCVCALGDYGITRNIFFVRKFPAEDIYLAAMEAMMRSYRLGMLEVFIKHNYERTLKGRFSLWQYAIKNRLNWEFHNNPALDLEVFRTIVTLLFPQEIDAQDEHKQSLLHWAIRENNAGAVRFLIEQGASINLPGPGGYLPLYNAYEDPEITQLLIDHGASVNERSVGGRTAIMSAICHGKCVAAK